MNRDITGFYFDQEKKKYFKIIPNHIAPQGAQYSRENIKKSKDNERKRKRSSERAHLTKSHIQRSKILTHPTSSTYHLSLETSTNTPPRRGIRAQTYAQGLERTTTFCTGESSGIQHFARDEATGGIFFGSNSMSQSQLKGVPPTLDSKGKITYPPHRIKPISSPNASEITSINISPTRTLISTTLGDSTSSSILLTKLVDPSQFDGTWLDVGVHTLLHPRDLTIWTSTPSPSPQTPSFAIGTSNGTLLLQETPQNWTETRFLTSQTDIFALEFLAPDIIAAGGRDSSVRIYDQRKAKAKVGMLRHPSSVMGVRRVDEWRVVVAGLRGMLRMYDLRMQVQAQGRTGKGMGRGGGGGGGGGGGKITTQPIVEYPTYSNDYRLDLGFDIDTETGLVAAASDQNTLQLFALHSGEEIKSEEGDRGFDNLVRCVRFSQAPGQAHRAKELLVSVGNRLECFSWYL